MQPRSSYVTVTDMFCGAGGSSIGVVKAGAELRMAMNHWALAIESHNTNFPDSDHSLTDIRTADPRRYPTTDVLIASPECTAHTLAKGRKRKDQQQLDLFGKSAFDPAEERSRATMWDVPRFAEHHRYNIVIVENVVDACLYWEPFDAWLMAMAALGYEHQLVFLNSMFAHPTPQSRDRLYVVFHRRGNRAPNLTICPPAWCQHCQVNIDALQAWKNQARRRGKYGARNQYVYRCPKCHDVVSPYYFCAANAIDWSIVGKRIGDRKVPLKPKTLERIRYGLQKFGHQRMVMRYDGEKVRPLSSPIPTLTTWDMLASVAPSFVMGTDHGGESGHVYSTLGPIPTQTGQQDKALVSLPMLLGRQSEAVARSVDEATPTVSTAGAISVITPPFIAELRGQSTVGEITEPLATLTAGGGHHGLVQPPAPFLMSFYGERHGTHPVDDPMVTVAGRDNHALVLPEALVGCLRENNVLAPVDQPVRSVIAGGNQHFLLLPFYGNAGRAHGVEEATRTVSTHDREGLLGVAPEVEDCHFRMLQPQEIQRAMAFPDNYVVKGTARDRVKQLGNAVTPPVMSLLFERCVATLAG